MYPFNGCILCDQIKLLNKLIVSEQLLPNPCTMKGLVRHGRQLVGHLGQHICLHEDHLQVPLVQLGHDLAQHCNFLHRRLLVLVQVPILPGSYPHVSDELSNLVIRQVDLLDRVLLLALPPSTTASAPSPPFLFDIS